MKDQFVTYEIAKQLKELGFDEECIKWFNVKEELVENSIFSKNGNICYPKNSDFKCDGMITASLWQQVIDFIWKKYHILINTYQISHEDIVWQVIYEFYPTKEQAILKAIELCQNKK